MADDAYLRYSNRVATERSGGRYDLSEIWIVTNIDNTDGGLGTPPDSWENEALNATGLPELGDANQDGGYICISRSPRSTDDQGTAYVEVRYVEDPLTLVTEVHYFGQMKQKPAWQGILIPYGAVGTPPVATAAPTTPPTSTVDDLFDFDLIDDIRNSAGDRWSPQPGYNVPLQRVEICFRASLSWFDTGVAAGDTAPGTAFTGNWEDYIGRWNETDYEVTQVDPDNSDNNTSVTYPAGTLMLMDVRAPLVKEPYFHRLVTCIFCYDPDMWCSRLPDMGPRCKKHLGPDGSGGVKQIPWTKDGKGRGTVTDALGRPYSGAAELDGNAAQLVPTGSDGALPAACIYQIWVVDENEDLLNAEFDDLDLFTPERTLNI